MLWWVVGHGEGDGSTLSLWLWWGRSGYAVHCLLQQALVTHPLIVIDELPLGGLYIDIVSLWLSELPLHSGHSHAITSMAMLPRLVAVVAVEVAGGTWHGHKHDHRHKWSCGHVAHGRNHNAAADHGSRHLATDWHRHTGTATNSLTTQT